MTDDIKRVRSPNYPSISLKDAIAHLNAFWPKMHTHPAPRDLVLKTMGYSSYNGASGSALSAHVKYGILEKIGENYKITDLGQRILHPHTPEEKIQAIRTAALAPPLFTDLLGHFNGTIPPSDEIIRSYLSRHGFANSAIPAVIQSFRETMELVPNDISPEHLTATHDSSEESGFNTPTQNNVVTPQPLNLSDVVPKISAITVDGEKEFLHGPLSKNTSYRLIVKGELGTRELSKLIKILELQKEIFSDDIHDEE